MRIIFYVTLFTFHVDASILSHFIYFILLVYTAQLNRSLNVYFFASVKISVYPQSFKSLRHG